MRTFFLRRAHYPVDARFTDPLSWPTWSRSTTVLASSGSLRGQSRLLHLISRSNIAWRILVRQDRARNKALREVAGSSVKLSKLPRHPLLVLASTFWRGTRPGDFRLVMQVVHCLQRPLSPLLIWLGIALRGRRPKYFCGRPLGVSRK